MNNLRVAVVGTGYLGRFHAEKYARMPGVDLVGVVDIDPDRANAVAEQYQTTAHTDYRELLTRVDAASIVVPTSLHYAISKDFIEHGVDLLIEKPMTVDLPQADELIALAESFGTIIQVGHLERFNPAVVALRDILKKPMFIEAHRLSTYKGRGIDVSVVLDLMIHDIDIILNCVRSEIVNIHATGVPVVSEPVDIANARLEFASGCVANVTTSRISTRDERKIRFFQRDAYISVDFANRSIVTIRQTGEKAGGLIPGMDIQKRDFTQGDALDDELKSFVRSVRLRETAAVTGQAGRDALAVALSIMDQIEVSSAKLLSNL